MAGRTVALVVACVALSAAAVLPGAFAAVTVSSVAISGASALNPAGGTAVTVSGTDFAAGFSVEYTNGVTTYSPACSLGGATTLSCTATAGSGANHVWSVTVGGDTGTAPGGQETSYSPPSVSGVSTPGALATSGGATLTLTGLGFGPASASDPAATVVVTYGPTTGSEYTATSPTVVSNTQITAVTAPGVGQSLRFHVTVTGQPSTTLTSALGYAGPTLSSVSGGVGNVLDSLGGETVTYQGTNFGPLGTTVSSLMSSSVAGLSAWPGVGCSVTVAHTTMTCESPAGNGREYTWRVTVDGQNSAFDDTVFRFETPTISSLTGGSGVVLTALQARGGQSVTVAGAGFGPAGNAHMSAELTSPNMVVAGPLVASCSVSSDTSAVCTTPVGVGRDYTWVVDVGDQPSASAATQTSYAPPTVTDVENAFAAPAENMYVGTSGGDSITIFGTGFGGSETEGDIAVTYGPEGSLTKYTAASCQVLTVAATSQVRCSTVEGLGAGMIFVLTVGGQSGTQAEASLSYRPSTVTQVTSGGTTPAVLLTAAPATVVLQGTDFGATGSPVVVTYGPPPSADKYTATGCSVTTAHTQVTCQSAIGVGQGLRWAVRVDDVFGVPSSLPAAVTRYATPTIAGVTPGGGVTLTSIDTRGGEAFTVTGSNFGPGEVDDNFNVTYSAGARTFIAVCGVGGSPHTSRACTTVAGVGASLQVAVVVGGQTSAAGGALTYTVPEISSVTPPAGGTMATDAGETFVVAGDFFGPINTEFNSVTATYSNDGSGGGVASHDVACSVTVAHTELTCQTEAGTGAAFTVVAHVGGQSSPASSDAIAYTVPAVTAVEDKQALPTVGGEFVRVQGTNFGPVTNTPLWTGLYGTRAGGDAVFGAPCTVDVAHTSMECNTTAGWGRDLQWSVVVDGQTSAVFTDTATSYATPAVTAVAPPIIDTPGGDAVTLSGIYFGPPSGGVQGTVSNVLTAFYAPSVDGSAPVDEYAAGVCTHTQYVATCQAAPGVGKNLKWRVVVGDQTSANSTATNSYRKPSIGGIAAACCADGTGLDTRGGDTVTLTGTNFGPFTAADVVHVIYANDQAFPTSYTATACTVTTPHTEVTCTSAAGIGKQHRWRITVGAQQSDKSTATSSYHEPVLTTMTSPATFPSSGGTTITFDGDYFGTADTNGDHAAVAVYGNAATAGAFATSYTTAACTVSVDETQLECDTEPGVGADHVWRIRIGGPTNNAGQLSGDSATTNSYIVPAITSVDTVPTRLLSTDGGETLVVHGSNFGPTFSTVATRVIISNPAEVTFDFLADACTVSNHDRIDCDTPQGFGTALEATVRAGDQVSSAAAVEYNVAYFAPELVDVVPPCGPLEGATRINVTGSNVSYTGELSIGDLVCSDEAEFTHTLVRCATPSGSTPGNVNLEAVVGGQASNTIPFAYYRADTVSPAFGPVRGGTSVVVSGTGFVDSGPAIVHSVPVGSLYNDTSVVDVAVTSVGFAQYTFETGLASTSGTVDMWANINTQQFTQLPTQFYYYDPPRVTSLEPRSGPISGGTVVAVSGYFYGTGVVAARFGQSQTEVSCTWVSDAEVTCVSPPVTLADEGEFALEISVDTPDSAPEQFSTSGVEFQYYEDPEFRSAYPPLGPAAGGTTVKVYGDGFVSTGDTIRMGFVQVGGGGASQKVVGSINFENTAYEDVPWSGSNQWVVQAATPPLPAGTYIIDVEINGQQNTTSTFTYEFYDEPVFESVWPPFAPGHGSTNLGVRGSGFVNASYGRFVRLKFSGPGSGGGGWTGDTIMDAAFVNSSFIAADTVAVPGSSPGVFDVSVALTLNRQDYTAVTLPFSWYRSAVTGVVPLSGPVSGRTVVSVEGVGFQPTGVAFALFSASAEELGGQDVTDVWQVCGDGACTPPSEDGANCPSDCDASAAAVCGDGVCDSAAEACTTPTGDPGQPGRTACLDDCGSCQGPLYCGDGLCSATESCAGCSADCGVCASPTCGVTGIGQYEWCRLAQDSCTGPRGCDVSGGSYFAVADNGRALAAPCVWRNHTLMHCSVPSAHAALAAAHAGIGLRVGVEVSVDTADTKSPKLTSDGSYVQLYPPYNVDATAPRIVASGTLGQDGVPQSTSPKPQLRVFGNALAYSSASKCRFIFVASAAGGSGDHLAPRPVSTAAHVTLDADAHALRYSVPVTARANNNVVGGGSPGGSTLVSNVHVEIPIDTASLISQNKMQPDCSDVRVRKSDRRTDLPMWLEPWTCGSADARIWTTVPSLHTDADATLYLQYGDPHPDRVSASDPYAVFNADQGKFTAFTSHDSANWVASMSLPAAYDISRGLVFDVAAVDPAQAANPLAALGANAANLSAATGHVPFRSAQRRELPFVVQARTSATVSAARVNPAGSGGGAGGGSGSGSGGSGNGDAPAKIVCYTLNATDINATAADNSTVLGNATSLGNSTGVSNATAPSANNSTTPTNNTVCVEVPVAGGGGEGSGSGDGHGGGDANGGGGNAAAIDCATYFAYVAVEENTTYPPSTGSAVEWSCSHVCVGGVDGSSSATPKQCVFCDLSSADASVSIYFDSDSVVASVSGCPNVPSVTLAQPFVAPGTSGGAGGGSGNPEVFLFFGAGGDPGDEKDPAFRWLGELNYRSPQTAPAVSVDAGTEALYVSDYECAVPAYPASLLSQGQSFGGPGLATSVYVSVLQNGDSAYERSGAMTVGVFAEPAVVAVTPSDLLVDEQRPIVVTGSAFFSPPAGAAVELVFTPTGSARRLYGQRQLAGPGDGSDGSVGAMRTHVVPATVISDNTLTAVAPGVVIDGDAVAAAGSYDVHVAVDGQVASNGTTVFMSAPQRCVEVLETFEPILDYPDIPGTRTQAGGIDTARGGEYSAACGLPIIPSGANNTLALVFTEPPQDAVGGGVVQQDVRLRAVRCVYGGSVDFDLRFGSPDASGGGVGGSFCRAADSSGAVRPGGEPIEPVVLQASVDGGSTWTRMETYQAGAVQSWTSVSVPLPATLRTQGTVFRLMREVDTRLAGAGDWAVDNLQVNAYPTTVGLQVLTVDSFSPASGPVTGYTNVTVRGFFGTNLAVKCWFGDQMSLFATQISETEMFCVAPPSVPREVKVYVVACGVQYRESEATFVYYRTPVVRALSGALDSADDAVQLSQLPMTGGTLDIDLATSTDAFTPAEEVLVDVAWVGQDPAGPADGPFGWQRVSLPAQLARSDIIGRGMPPAADYGDGGFPLSAADKYGWFKWVVPYEDLDLMGLVPPAGSEGTSLGVTEIHSMQLLVARPPPSGRIQGVSVGALVTPFDSWQRLPGRDPAIATNIASEQGLLRATNLDMQVPPAGQWMTFNLNPPIQLEEEEVRQQRSAVVLEWYQARPDDVSAEDAFGAVEMVHAMGYRAVRWGNTEDPPPGAPLITTGGVDQDYVKETRVPVLRLCRSPNAGDCPHYTYVRTEVPSFIPASAGPDDPAAREGLKGASVDVTVAVNGQQYEPADVELLLYDGAFPVSSISPPLGPVDGGTEFTISIDNEDMSTQLTEMVVGFRSSVSHGEYAKKEFMPCEVTTPTTTTCVSPHFDPVETLLSFSMNGGATFLEPELAQIFQFYLPPNVDRVCGDTGQMDDGEWSEAEYNAGCLTDADAAGQQAFLIHGTGFFQGQFELLSCRWGSTCAGEVPGTGSRCLATIDSNVYYVFEPEGSKNTGGIIIGGPTPLSESVATPTRAEFLQCNGADATDCTMRCLTPPRPAGQWEVDVSINGADWSTSAPTGVPGVDVTVFNGCPAGSFASTFDLPCEPCEPGTFAATAGSEECEPCAIGTYASQYGSELCDNCPLFSTTLAYDTRREPGLPEQFLPIGGATDPVQECLCQTGTMDFITNKYEPGTGAYMTRSATDAGANCQPLGNGDYQCCEQCPLETSICVGGDRPPHAAPGFWQPDALLSSTYNLDVTDFRRCTPPEACKECDGACQNRTAACKAEKDASGDPHLNCQEECLCDWDIGCYTGPMCGVCGQNVWFPDRGEYKSFYRDGDGCLPCPPSNPLMWIVSGFGIIFVLWVFTRLAPYLKGLGSPRILTTFMYVSLSFSDLNVEWPIELYKFFRWLRVFYIDIDWIKPECAVHIEFSTKFLMVQLFPVFLLLLLVVFFLTRTYLRCKCCSRENAKKIAESVVTANRRASQAGADLSSSVIDMAYMAAQKGGKAGARQACEKFTSAAQSVLVALLVDTVGAVLVLIPYAFVVAFRLALQAIGAVVQVGDSLWYVVLYPWTRRIVAGGDAERASRAERSLKRRRGFLYFLARRLRIVKAPAASDKAIEDAAAAAGNASGGKAAPLRATLSAFVESTRCQLFETFAGTVAIASPASRVQAWLAWCEEATAMQTLQPFTAGYQMFNTAIYRHIQAYYANQSAAGTASGGLGGDFEEFKNACNMLLGQLELERRKNRDANGETLNAAQAAATAAGGVGGATGGAASAAAAAAAFGGTGNAMQRALARMRARGGASAVTGDGAATGSAGAAAAAAAAGGSSSAAAESKGTDSATPGPQASAALFAPPMLREQSSFADDDESLFDLVERVAPGRLTAMQKTRSAAIAVMAIGKMKAAGASARGSRALGRRSGATTTSFSVGAAGAEVELASRAAALPRRATTAQRAAESKDGAGDAKAGTSGAMGKGKGKGKGEGSDKYAGLTPERKAELEAQDRVALRIKEKEAAEAKVKADERAQSEKNLIINAYAMVLIFSHVTLSKRIMQIFVCSEQPNGSSLLVADLTIECGSAAHTSLVFFALVFGALYTIGIPLWVFVQLTVNTATAKRRYLRDTKSRYGYMYLKYRPDAFFWELCLLLRKFTVVIVRMLTTDADMHVLQILILLAFLIVMLGLQAQKKPFVEAELNKIEALAIFDNILVLCAALMFLTQRVDIEEDPLLLLPPGQRDQRIAITSSTFAYTVVFLVLGALAKILHVVVKEVLSFMPYLPAFGQKADVAVMDGIIGVFKGLRRALVFAGKLSVCFGRCLRDGHPLREWLEDYDPDDGEEEVDRARRRAGVKEVLMQMWLLPYTGGRVLIAKGGCTVPAAWAAWLCGAEESVAMSQDSEVRRDWVYLDPSRFDPPSYLQDLTTGLLIPTERTPRPSGESLAKDLQQIYSNSMLCFAARVVRNPLLPLRTQRAAVSWMQDQNTTYRDVQFFVSSLEKILERVSGGFLGLDAEQDAYKQTLHRSKHVNVLRTSVVWLLLIAEVVFVWLGLGILLVLGMTPVRQWLAGVWHRVCGGVLRSIGHSWARGGVVLGAGSHPYAAFKQQRQEALRGGGIPVRILVSKEEEVAAAEDALNVKFKARMADVAAFLERVMDELQSAALGSSGHSAAVGTGASASKRASGVGTGASPTSPATTGAGAAAAASRGGASGGLGSFDMSKLTPADAAAIMPRVRQLQAFVRDALDRGTYFALFTSNDAPIGLYLMLTLPTLSHDSVADGTVGAAGSGRRGSVGGPGAGGGGGSRSRGAAGGSTIGSPAASAAGSPRTAASHRHARITAMKGGR